MRFKHYNQNQLVLFPYSFDDLIPENHPVRVVNSILDRINIDPLLRAYSKEGNPSYHPVMMLKVMVFAYMNNIYSSRKIEKALRENINFMWLSNMSMVDHNTVNRFRAEKLQEAFKDIFKQVVLLLVKEGLVSMKHVFVDGTKIEAQAGRYTFVWANAIKTNKEKMLRQLEDLWKYAQSVAREEDQDPEPPEFKEISTEKIQEAVENINAKLKGSNGKTDQDKKARAKLNYIKNNFEKNLEKYQAQEEILAGRNSYSKTDEDATFMRMKDDHMQNGQLKPAYNAQISTENQYILNYSIHQQTNDFHTLKSHLDHFEKLYGPQRMAQLEELTADAGYVSEQNYELLASKSIIPFVKYNTFDKEQDANYQKRHKTFSKENLHYNAKHDHYICPMGQKMEKTHESTRRNKNGYLQKSSHYQARNCQGCPMRGACHSSKENRSIERNHHLEQYKERIRQLLRSEEGIKKRKQRSVEVEPVFAHLKHCNGFKRFTLKGLPKVELEFGLHALAHNLRKKVA